VNVLRSDNRGEYTSKEFKEYLASKGIKHQLSIPWRSEQNGLAEHLNRTLTKRARSIRLHIDMLEEFWAEDGESCEFLVNRSPSITIDLQIPEDIWRGESVDYSTLRIFGCPAYSFVDSQKRNKLEFKTKECIFIGSPKESKVPDFGISKQGAPLPAEMSSLTKYQCCKKS